MDSIRVFAPASVANMVSGFDILGFAIDEPGDELVLKKKERKGITLDIIGRSDLPDDPAKNTSTFGVLKALEEHAPEAGLHITLYKNLPLGSGMGSSAASAAAGVFGVNQLLGLNLSKNNLLAYSAAAESMVSGGIHLDNIAPSLLGGITLVQSKEPIDVVKLHTSLDLHCALIHPHVSVNTKDARQLLRDHVPLKKVVDQSGHLGGFIAGILGNDIDLMRRSMIDEIVEPVRAVLVPGFEEAREKAKAHNIIGCGLSGSGPTMFIIGTDTDAIKAAARDIQSVFKGLEIQNDVYYSAVGGKGARIID